MIRDPFYRVVVERLGGGLDPEIFERCATDLLRDELPTLVPIRGGTDAGMDGAIADGRGEAYPLVCTTSKDVIGNLTRNLDSYVSSGGMRRRAVLATSRELSAHRRRNLSQRAEEKGFELIHIYDQAAFADRLYRNSRWSKELLGLTGAPSALSVVPLTRRPLINISVVGCETELSWLRETQGDRLLIGPSGSGKTFVLYTLVLQGWGLFLVSEDLPQIAAALRDQQPGVVIVDDAHLNPERVVELRRLRDETGADFSIMATAWKGEEAPVVEALCIPDTKVCELDLLGRDEIVTVVEEGGVRGPLWLVRDIVDQAEGRPGLAVTLSQVCLQGGVREVALGQHLLRHTVTAFERLVGPEMTQVLAAFAIGGNAGMSQRLVSRELGMPLYKLHAAVTRLAVGGVVDTARHASWRLMRAEPNEDNLVVRPPNLRYALVRDVFFGHTPTLPYRTLVDAAPDATEVARTLVRSARYGASIPPDVLVASLDRAGASAPWDEYAALGATQSKWILDNRPELLEAIALPALLRAPEDSIPRLLDSAIGNKGPLNSHPEHPLRVLDDWVKAAEPGTGEALSRRKLLIEVVATWISTGGEDEVAVRVLCLAMSPEFGDAFSDPGSGRRFTMRLGLLLPEELTELQRLWGRVLELLTSLSSVAWKHVIELVREWSYPNPQITGVDEYMPSMRLFAGELLSDIAEISDGHPGVLHQVHEQTRLLGQATEIALDEEFETLFPLDRLDEDYRSSHERQVAVVRELAISWSASDPVVVAERIRNLESAAADVGLTYPRHTPLLCREIAERCTRPGDWMRALLDERSSGDLLAPFLEKAAKNNENGWEDVATSLLKDPLLKHIAVVLILTHPDPPTQLLSTVLASLDGLENVVDRYAAWGRIPTVTLARLLAHDNTKIATAAALGEWRADPAGSVRGDLLSAWRAAILATDSDEHGLGEALQDDPSLAYEWLLKRIADEPSVSLFSLKGAVMQAATVLNRRQRRSVLRALQRPLFGGASLALQLVGDDLDFYSEVLGDKRLCKIHLAPLAGRPTGTWPQKAKLALSVGYSPEEVAYAAYSGGTSRSGSESTMWRSWEEQFANLRAHEEAGVRATAEVGHTYARQRCEEALKKERLESVYGR